MDLNYTIKIIVKRLPIKLVLINPQWNIYIITGLMEL